MKHIYLLSLCALSLTCVSADAETIAQIDYDTHPSAFNFAFTFEQQAPIELVSGNTIREASITSGPTLEDIDPGPGVDRVLTANARYDVFESNTNILRSDTFFGFGILSDTTVAVPTTDLSQLTVAGEFWSAGLSTTNAEGTFSVLFDYGDDSFASVFVFTDVNLHNNSHDETSRGTFQGNLSDATYMGPDLATQNLTAATKVRFRLAGVSNLTSTGAVSRGFSADGSAQLFFSSMSLSAESAAVPEPTIVWPLALLATVGGFRAYRRNRMTSA